MTRRDIPSPVPSNLEPGCVAALLLPFLAGAAILLWARPRWWAIVGLVLVAPATIAVLLELKKMLLLSRARRRFRKDGKVGFLITSDSPNWGAHIEERWCPRIRPHVHVLNWSQNRQWDARDLVVQTFEAFVGRRYQFNPAVVVFRRNGKPLVFRFYQAFKNAKHGRAEDLAQLEQAMFEAIEQQANSTLPLGYRQ